MIDDKLIQEMVDRQYQLWRVLKLICDFDHLPRVIWDYEGNLIYVNKKFAKALGYTFSEMIGKPFANFVVEEDLENSINELEQNIEYGKIMNQFVNKYYKKDRSIAELTWLIAFNDSELQIGSGQVIIKDINK